MPILAQASPLSACRPFTCEARQSTGWKTSLAVALSFSQSMVDSQGQMGSLVQALLNRMDHLECSLLRRSNESVHAVEQSQDDLRHGLGVLHDSIERFRDAHKQ